MFQKKQHPLENSTLCVIGNEQEQNIMLELNSPNHYVYIIFSKEQLFDGYTLLLCSFILFIVRTQPLCYKNSSPIHMGK